MPIITSDIQLSNSDLPLLTETILTQQVISKDGNSIPISNLVLLPQVLASLDIPPNSTTLEVDHRILLIDNTNTQTQADIRNDYLAINDTVNANYYSFNSDTLQVNNITNTSYISMNPFDGLLIQNDVKGGAPTNINTITHSQITIDNTPSGGPINTLNPNQISINDPTNGYISTMSNANLLFNDNNGGLPLQMELMVDHTVDPEPMIRLQDVNGFNNFIKYSGIYANKNLCFNLDNDNKFMKQQNPFSMQQYELLDGEKIKKYMPFVFVQNVSGIRLKDVSKYFDDNGLVGWSCIVSNYSGGTITIDTAGYRWYDHAAGLGNDPIQLNKWATCRLTLVYSSIDNEYLWALSQF